MGLPQVYSEESWGKLGGKFLTITSQNGGKGEFTPRKVWGKMGESKGETCELLILQKYLENEFFSQIDCVAGSTW